VVYGERKVVEEEGEMKVIIADLHNSLALWTGEEGEQDERYARMRHNAKAIRAKDLFDKNMVKLREGDVSSDEFGYAEQNMVLTRRTVIRLKERQ